MKRRMATTEVYGGSIDIVNLPRYELAHGLLGNTQQLGCLCLIAVAHSQSPQKELLSHPGYVRVNLEARGRFGQWHERIVARLFFNNV